MASLLLLEGVTIWMSVVFVLVSCLNQPILSSHHMLCLVCWFITQLVVMSCGSNNKSSSYNENQRRIYRPGADNGLWCCLLVPLSVLGGITEVYKIQNDVHSKDSAALQADLVFSLMSSTTVISSTRHPYLIFPVVWILPLVINLDPLTAVLLVSLCVTSHLGVSRIPLILPKSFSAGEIAVLVQLVTLIAWRSISYLTTLLMEGHTDPSRDVSVVSVIGFSSATVAVIAALYFHNTRRPLVFFTTFAFVAVVLAFPALYVYLNMDPVTWVLVYVFSSERRIFLLLYWLVCSLTAVAVVRMANATHSQNMPPQLKTDVLHVNMYTKTVQPKQPPVSQNSTVIRKYFHFLALGVYIPGFVLDAGFLCLGSAVALVVLVLLEAIRVARVPPLGGALDEAFCVFVDEKDAGKCIFTHIYLLVGMSVPIWISYSINNTDFLLPQYSGVLSLAVGDTAASIGGSLFGHHRWPGTKKTIEGSLCCVASQLTFLFILAVLGLLALPNVIFLTIAVVLVSCYEAFTLQIDNLVLPLLTFALLSVL